MEQAQNQNDPVGLRSKNDRIPFMLWFVGGTKMTFWTNIRSGRGWAILILGTYTILNYHLLRWVENNTSFPLPTSTVDCTSLFRISGVKHTVGSYEPFNGNNRFFVTKTHCKDGSQVVCCSQWKSSPESDRGLPASTLPCRRGTLLWYLSILASSDWTAQ